MKTKNTKIEELGNRNARVSKTGTNSSQTSSQDNGKAPRKWDGEIDIARNHDTWLAFESDIHQSAALRARVARSLDRYGLGTSDVAVEGALDYLTRKELGASARYFNQSGKAQFNQQQITHAVLSFMAGKEHHGGRRIRRG